MVIYKEMHLCFAISCRVTWLSFFVHELRIQPYIRTPIQKPASKTPCISALRQTKNIFYKVLYCYTLASPLASPPGLDALSGMGSRAKSPRPRPLPLPTAAMFDRCKGKFYTQPIHLGTFPTPQPVNLFCQCITQIQYTTPHHTLTRHTTPHHIITCHPQ